MRAPVLVLGVGNPWRGDDGVGAAVVRAVADRLEVGLVSRPDGEADGAPARLVAEPGLRVEVAELDGEPARTIEAWRDRALAVVVDAVVSGAEPGTLHRRVLDRGSGELVTDMGCGAAPGEAAGRVLGGAGGSHALGVHDAVRLGRALGRLPERLVVVGVEAAAFDHSDGLALDPRVATAVGAAVELVLGELGAAEVRVGVGRSLGAPDAEGRPCA